MRIAFPLTTPACIVTFLLAWGASTLLGAEPVLLTGPEFNTAIQPQVAVEGKLVYVVFGTKEGSILSARSTNSAVSFDVPRKVDRLDTLALGMRRGPRIATVAGRVVITAISHGTGNVYAWSSDDQGGSWSKKKQINDVERSAREGLQALASDGQTNLFAAWLDLRNGKTELWGAKSADGGKTWKPNVFIYRSPAGHICECCHPSLTFSADGKIFAMWRNWDGAARDMYWSSSADGKTFGPGSKSGSGSWILKACPMDGGSLASGPNGQLVSVWRRNTSIFAAAQDQPEVRLAGQGTQPVLIANANATNVLWTSGAKIWLKRGFASDASPELLTEQGTYPSAAFLEDQRSFIVAWQSAEGGRPGIFAVRMR